MSGNPGGRPTRDLASEIAQALFEQDGPAIFAAFQRALCKGSPYAFAVLADRAFGRLKETHMIERSPYKNVSDADLEKQIGELQDKLIASLIEQGYTVTAPPQLLPSAGDFIATVLSRAVSAHQPRRNEFIHILYAFRTRQSFLSEPIIREQTFQTRSFRDAHHVIEPVGIMSKCCRGRLAWRDSKFARIPEVNLTGASNFKPEVHHLSV